ncbi:unnamed protein product [Cladocopium goreaui]|uniref:Retrotransposon gag domain-containing protein n=1 Tax=Cladocopium goreaui TaxID=2562237 RepID=A0A9P1GJ84_9DINO|nr:unnamed protein product [Cladocopium goreaui]
MGSTMIAGGVMRTGRMIGSRMDGIGMSGMMIDGVTVQMHGKVRDKDMMTVGIMTNGMMIGMSSGTHGRVMNILHGMNGMEEMTHGTHGKMRKQKKVRPVSKHQKQGSSPKKHLGKIVVDNLGAMQLQTRHVLCLKATLLRCRLVEQLTGAAWRATETLDMSTLRQEGGVDTLLSHLREELEPIEHLQVFSTLSNFFKSFRRSKGQEFVDFDTQFRVQCQKLEEVGAGLSGLIKSYWFLETASLSDELRKQVITAANGSYQYEKLRLALMAIVPRVRREQGESQSSTSSADHKKSNHFRGKFYGQNAHGVNVVEDATDHDLEQIQEEPDSEDSGSTPQADDDAQSQIMMTQAAKKRATVEKSRGYTTKPKENEKADDRNKRIAAMKANMACSACRANGRVVYGHWHQDPECPFYGSKDGGKKGAEIFCVQTDEEDDSDDEIFTPDVNTIMMTYAGHHGPEKMKKIDMALSDTCCSRTVAGAPWVASCLRRLWKNQIMFYVVRENQAFRFGPGPKKWSQAAVVIPTSLHNDTMRAYLRISVVEDDVPLLVSHRALTDLGAVLNLPKQCIEMKSLEVMLPLISTLGGHVGFPIWNDTMMHDFLGDEEYVRQLCCHEDVEVMLVENPRMELVESIALRCKVSKPDLGVHGVERLREIWRVVKPVKVRLMPAGWKKMDLQELKDLYEELVVPYYDRPSDQHWARMRRGQLVTELEMYEADRKAEMADQGGVIEDLNDPPKCPTCDIPMIIRENRLTKDPFFGCLRYPYCKSTLPYKYDNRPTKEAQDEMQRQEMLEQKKKSEAKVEVKKNAAALNQKKRAVGSAGYQPESDGSWAPVPSAPELDSDGQDQKFNVNTNLSQEEVNLIMEMRRRDAVSYQFSRWGWNTLEPIDQIYGTDLTVEANRERIIHWIEKFRPRLVVETPTAVNENPGAVDSQLAGAVASSAASAGGALHPDGIKFDIPKGRQAVGCVAVERIAMEAAWAKNSLTREHGWSPVALVFGREPRVSGELVQDGNPVSYHFDVGDEGDEVHYGDPSVQKAIALFRKVPDKITFEDLTQQPDPKDEDFEMNIFGLGEGVFMKSEDEDHQMDSPGVKVPVEVVRDSNRHATAEELTDYRSAVEADDILMTGKEKKLVYSQKGAVLGLVSQGDIDKGEPVKMNILDWRSTTNKRVIESSLAAETHAAIQAHGLSRFVQALLAEATLGTEVVSYLDDEDWQSIAPLNMITDCKSIYDHVRKDGQHLSEKGNVIQVMLLRKMCSTRPHTGKARLLWVPTRNQLADGLTKTGRGKHIRENLGEAKFHEEAAPRRKWSTAKDSYASVN